MFERFTRTARQTVVGAQRQALELGHGWIGTEHLLLALLDQPGARIGPVLAAAGASPAAIRDEVLRLAPGSEPGLDADALATLGIDLDQVRERVERTFGRGALLERRCRRGPARGALPFTAEAKRTLELGLREALDRGDRFIGAEHILLALLRGGGVAGRVLDAYGIEHRDVHAALGDRAAR